MSLLIKPGLGWKWEAEVGSSIWDLARDKTCPVCRSRGPTSTAESRAASGHDSAFRAVLGQCQLSGAGVASKRENNTADFNRGKAL